MKTIGELLKLSCDFAIQKNPDCLRRDIEELIASRLGLKRLHLYTNFDQPVEEKELPAIREGLKRLIANEPIQYIIGEVEFSGCRMLVNRDVLIPRPETELIVESIVERLKIEDLAGKSLLDLCSGSGYIGIAIKKALPELTVILSDISPAACALAKKNAEFNNVSIELLQGDFLKPMQGRKVDFLVCNPPYISEAEYKVLDASVKNFEPKLALVGGVSGLEFYERLACEAGEIVASTIFLEIGTGQGAHVCALFAKAGYTQITLEKDLSGHDRFITIQK